MRNLRFIALAIVAASISVGCAKKAQQTGFLSTYRNLEPISSHRMQYNSGEMGDYSNFIVEPVEVKLSQDEAKETVRPADLKRLQKYFHAEILKAKPAGYQIVSRPETGVARIRIALTNIEKATPAFNVLPETKLSGLGLGQASVEMEIVDSQTGRQLFAAIYSETGSRFSLAGLSKYGDVKAVIKEWAKQIWKRIDEAHGIKK